MMIEQASFLSAAKDTDGVVRLTARSPNILPADLRDLAAWIPPCAGRGNPAAHGSVYFHHLPSGALCVGYRGLSHATGHDDAERDDEVSAQCLIVPPHEFARFANNPFALLRAARANGAFKPRGNAGNVLDAIELPGEAPAVDEGLLGELIDRYGARHLAWLVQTVLAADAVVFVGAEKPDWLLAGLLNCLPAECRPELSLATGLPHSPRRPYRLNTLAIEAAERRRIVRQSGVTLINPDDEPPTDFEPTGWASYLDLAIQADCLAEFAAELNRQRAGLRISDLGWLATQLTSRLKSSAAYRNLDLAPRNEPVAPTSNYAPSPRADFSPPRSRLPEILPQANPGSEAGSDGASEFRHAHRGHGRPTNKAKQNQSENHLPSVTAVAEATSPAKQLAGSDRELLEKLEHLDDLVFDTIGGKQQALDKLVALWPKTLAELPRDMLEESREQYLRYALTLWNSSQSETARDPRYAVAALDVLCVLFSAETC